MPTRLYNRLCWKYDTNSPNLRLWARVRPFACILSRFKRYHICHKRTLIIFGDGFAALLPDKYYKFATANTFDSIQRRMTTDCSLVVELNIPFQMLSTKNYAPQMSFMHCFGASWVRTLRFYMLNKKIQTLSKRKCILSSFKGKTYFEPLLTQRLFGAQC